MPFTSKAQARFMFAKHPGIAKEFASKTPSFKSLPEHVGIDKRKGPHGPNPLKGLRYKGYHEK